MASNDDELYVPSTMEINSDENEVTNIRLPICFLKTPANMTLAEYGNHLKKQMQKMEPKKKSKNQKSKTSKKTKRKKKKVKQAQTEKPKKSQGTGGNKPKKPKAAKAEKMAQRANKGGKSKKGKKSKKEDEPPVTPKRSKVVLAWQQFKFPDWVTDRDLDLFNRLSNSCCFDCEMGYL